MEYFVVRLALFDLLDRAEIDGETVEAWMPIHLATCSDRVRAERLRDDWIEAAGKVSNQRYAVLTPAEYEAAHAEYDANRRRIAAAKTSA